MYFANFRDFLPDSLLFALSRSCQNSCHISLKIYGSIFWHLNFYVCCTPTGHSRPKLFASATQIVSLFIHVNGDKNENL